MLRNEIINDVEIFMSEDYEVQPLSILFVIDSLETLGGLETYVITLINELSANGHKVYIDYKKADSLLLKQIETKNVFFLANRSVEEVAEIIKSENIDVIQSQPYNSGQRSYQLYKKTGVPFVFTCHSAIMDYNHIDDKIIANAARIIAVSQEIADILSSIYPYAKNKTVVIQNGINLKQFTPSPKAEKDGLSLAFIGRLDNDRKIGLEKLIDAYRKSSFSSLTICGAGKRKSQFEKCFASDPSIVFAGAVTNLNHLLKDSDVVIATGRGAREAMALGKPCIVLSNWGYDGIILPKTVDQMEYANFSGRGICKSLKTENIIRDLKILEDEEIRKQLGLFGRRLAEQRYSITEMAKKVLLVYRQAAVQKHTPTVSVILPVYNHAGLLTGAIDSILNQTFGSFELIIIDDGSTDNFDGAVSSYTDSRIRILKNPRNMKLPYTLNRGLLEARGKYITWTSADNLLLPKCLEVLVNALESRPECGSAYSDYEQIDAEGNVIQKMSKGVYNLDGKTNFGPSFLYRREVVQGTGFFDEDLFGVEDRDYSVRVAIEAPVLWIPQVLYRYRIHSNSLTGRYVKNKSMFFNSICRYNSKWASLLKTSMKHPESALPQGVPANVKFKNIPVAMWKKEYIIEPSKDCTVNSKLTFNLDFDPIYFGRYQESEYFSLMYFDLSSIPLDAKIVEAILELFIIRNDNGEEKEIVVRPLAAGWEEKSVNSQAMPQISNVLCARGHCSDVISWASVDITDIVNKWVNNELKNNGLVISASKDAKVFAAYNRHFYLKSLTPRLRILATSKVRGIKWSEK